MTVSVADVLAVASILFALGAAGAIARKSLLFVLVSIEVMFVAAGLAFVGVSAGRSELDGQVVYFFVLAGAAAQVSVGLALILRYQRRAHTIDADGVDTMRG